MLRPTQAYVDTQALKDNLTAIRSLLAPHVKCMAIIKADAYGHGMVQTAHAALEAGADYLGVAIIEEGALLRQAGIRAPILVLGGLLPEQTDAAVENELDLTVFSESILHALEKSAAKLNKNCNVHIKIDTGMNRIGIKDPAVFDALLDVFERSSFLTFRGIYTHFATSEIEDKTFTFEQAECLQKYVRTAQARGFSPIVHAANSGAILDLPQLHFDMVRAGICLYGYDPAPKTPRPITLKPVMSWKTQIVHIKELQPGDTVSYGRTFTAQHPMRIATLPVGYGDGYKRCLSNKAYVLIRGRRAPVIGTVCMDQIMCDVTDIQDAAVGDPVVLLGTQGNERIDADDMADWAGTISYEILLSISPRVPRRYI